jgi:hypothetical protein
METARTPALDCSRVDDAAELRARKATTGRAGPGAFPITRQIMATLSNVSLSTASNLLLHDRVILRPFKAVTGLAKRIWQRSPQKTPTPFSLLKVDSRPGARKAAKCRQRIENRAAHVHDTLSRARSAAAARPVLHHDLTRLHQDITKLEQLTGERVSLNTILDQQIMGRNTGVGDPARAQRRDRLLHKLSHGPLMAHAISQAEQGGADGTLPVSQDNEKVVRARGRSARRNNLLKGLPQAGETYKFAETALRELASSVSRERLLQATSADVQALCDAYAMARNGQPDAATLLPILGRLGNTANTPLWRDEPLQNTLYPAVKLIQSRGGLDAGGHGLSELLCDLATDGNAATNAMPARLLAAVGPWVVQQRDALAGRARQNGFEPNPSSSDSVDLAIQNATHDFQRLFNGLRGAALQVVRERLVDELAPIGHEIRPALFQESRVLYQSAAQWSTMKLHDKHPEQAILRSSPAEAVGILVNDAVSQAMDPEAAEWGECDPALGRLTHTMASILQPVADQIEETLRQCNANVFLAQGGYVEWADDLMSQVLDRAGVWQEIGRLQDAPRNTGELAGPPISAHPRDGNPLTIRRTRAHPLVAKAKARAAKDIRHFAKSLLDACSEKNARPARAYLDKSSVMSLLAARGMQEAGPSGLNDEAAWRAQIDLETAKCEWPKLVDLMNGPLRAHIMGEPSGDLLAGITDPIQRIQAHQVLDDTWQSIKQTSVRATASKSLKQWAAKISRHPTDLDDNTFARLIDQARGAIHVLSDGSVTQELLLATAVGDLTDQELGLLLEESFGPASVQTSRGYGRAERIAAQTNDVSASMKFDTRVRFLEQLGTAAYAELNRRADALAVQLMPEFRTALFAETARIHDLCGTEDARAVNGPPDALIGDMVAQFAPRIELGEDGMSIAPPTAMPDIFVLTQAGYQMSGVLSTNIGRTFSELSQKIDQELARLKLADFEDSYSTIDRHDKLVRQILDETGIWDRLCYWPFDVKDQESATVNDSGFDSGSEDMNSLQDAGDTTMQNAIGKDNDDRDDDDDDSDNGAEGLARELREMAARLRRTQVSRV